MGRIATTPSFVRPCLIAGAWLGSALYAMGEPGGDLKLWAPYLVAVSMIPFVVIDGCRSEGPRGLTIFVATVFVIGWSAETVSIVTGFPCGHYYYTDTMAPFVGQVPLFVMPAYVVMGYLSWAMARIMLPGYDETDSPIARYGVPVVAAALMTLWDLSMDPLRSTVEQRWIWPNGGDHLGVPLLNFVGWFVLSWTMFQTYALLRPPSPAGPKEDRPRETALVQLSVPLMYLALPLEYVLNPAVADPAHAATFIESAQHSVEHIYAATAFLTLVTIVPTAAFAGYRVLRGETSAVYLTFEEETPQ